MAALSSPNALGRRLPGNRDAATYHSPSHLGDAEPLKAKLSIMLFCEAKALHPAIRLFDDIRADEERQ